MGTSCLAVKRKAEELQTLSDIPVAIIQTNDPLRAQNNGKLKGLREGSRSFKFTPIKPRFVKLFGHITGNFEGLRHGAPLGDQTGNAFTGGQVATLRKPLQMKVDEPFSHDGGPAGSFQFRRVFVPGSWRRGAGRQTR